MKRFHRTLRLALVAAAAIAAVQARADVPVATGQFVTPDVVPGAVRQAMSPGLAAYPDFVASMAVRSQLSPDGNTLAVITAGHNGLYKLNAAGTGTTADTAASGQYLFIYDVSGANKAKPVREQVLQVPNAHVGLAFAPDGSTIYAGGGADDVVYTYANTAGTWAATGSIALGHANKGVGLSVRPNAGSVALSQDGATLVVVNNYNDSISVIDTATRKVRYEHDLRPYHAANEGTAGAAGGTFPFAVVVKGNGTAYVSSDRDREVVVVDISGATAGRLVKRIKLDGNALGMALDASQSRLYVAEENADKVAVIDTGSNAVLAQIDARAPAGLLGGATQTGAATSAVTLSRDGSTLYAVNSGSNSIAVIPLAGANANTVTGLIPTAYEPHDVTFSTDGSWMYVVNGKDATGPNRGHLSGSTGSMTSADYPGGNAATARAGTLSQQYQFQLERSYLVASPVPAAGSLPALTAQVAKNNFYGAAPVGNDAAVMAFLRDKIQHVVYIVKENRTFDQVLGDLTNGARTDPRIAQFGRRITPNYHALATQFVTLDNFMNPGDGSMDGWSWALQGRVTQTETITQQVNYSNISRGLSYETEGSNRNVPVNFPSVADRDTAAGLSGTPYTTAATAAALPGGVDNLLAGGGNHASSDAPFGIQKGYIFSAVLNAGKTVRNYGFLVNNVGSIGTKAAPVTDPFAAGKQQVQALDPELKPYTDLYFRGYDQLYPDIWRYKEWKREFDQFVANGQLPNLSLVRISHDHMGSFGSALGGFDTPEKQQGDCDYATGKIIEAIAHSPYAANTLVIVTEDDVQDGPDSVDSHRGPAFVVGPYVKKGGVVVSTRYSQVNALRTIEDVLGTQHINLNTAFQRPMADVFDITQGPAWSFTAVASSYLNGTTLTLADSEPTTFADSGKPKSTHSPAWWDRMTKGMNFAEADAVPPAKFNRILWTGMKGGKARYPGPLVASAGRDDD